MGQAKLRIRERESLKQPVLETKSGSVRVYRVKSLEKFQRLTGRLPFEFEQIESIGLELNDHVLSNLFETEVNTSQELDLGSWQDLVVEITGRREQGEKEYFAIRLGTEDREVSRPSHQDKITFSPIEAAFARFAAASNHLAWYLYHKREQGQTDRTKIGLMREISCEEASEYFIQCQFAYLELGFGQVHRWLD